MKIHLAVLTGVALAACQPTTTATKSSTSATFPELQAQVGVSTIGATCFSSLPNFKSAPELFSKNGLKSNGRAWVGGNGAIVASIQQDPKKSGCVVTIAQTKPGLVLAELKKEIKRKFSGAELGNANGTPSFRVPHRGKDFFVNLVSGPGQNVTVFTVSSKS